MIEESSQDGTMPDEDDPGEESRKDCDEEIRN